MHLRRIAHVNLSIRDVEGSRRFYQDVLGLAPAPRPQDAGRPGCWFRLGELELHLSLDPASDNAASKRHVAFQVDDIESARSAFAAAAIPVEEGQPMPGVRRFFVRDPSGNRLEFFATL